MQHQLDSRLPTHKFQALFYFHIPDRVLCFVLLIVLFRVERGWFNHNVFVYAIVAALGVWWTVKIVEIF